MSLPPEVLMSHRYDVLLEGLKKKLFTPTGGFRRKWVVIPTDWLKEFLLKEIATDPSLRVATGLRFLNLNLCVKDILTLIGDRKKEMKFPRRESLAFYIEREWTTLKEEYPSLKEYLEGHPHRGIDLADTMAHLMMKRVLHAEDGVEFLYDWQKALETKVFHHYDHPGAVIKGLKVPLSSEIDLELHLFGFHEMPSLYIEFFEKLATCFKVNFYQFAPTPYYWGDVLSQKGSLFLEKKLSLQGKIDEATAQYFFVANSLLAEGSQAAKPLFQEMVDRGFTIEEEIELEEESSTLAMIQNDLMEMQTRGSFQADDSVQLHVAPTLMQEVQIARMLIEQISLEKGARAAHFRVYCSDMSRYGPYIEYVFGDPSSRFGFICDNAQESESGLYHAFIAIMNTPFEFITPQEVFAILKCKAVLRKENLSVKEFDELSEWARLAQIDWGFDGAQRKAYHPNLTERGSWLWTIDQWILSLAFAQRSSPPKPPFEVAQFFPFSQAHILGSLLNFIKKLQNFSQKVGSFPKRSLLEWTLILEEVLETFFDLDENEEDYYEIEKIRGHIQNFRYLEASLVDYSLPYESIRKRVVDALSSQERRKYSQDDKEKISFLEVKKGQIVSSEHIILMGFDEESFPLPDAPISLIRLTNPAKRSLFIPSQQDLCHFLQLALQAKQTLIFTYCQQTEDPESLLSPSTCFSLLKEYGIKTRVHPLTPFASEYFEKEATLKNLSLIDFSIAKRRAPLLPLPECSRKEKQSSEELELHELKSFATHPLRFYLQRSLGIYLERKEEDLEGVKASLSYLDCHQFTSECLEKGKKETLRSWELMGKLPYGIFEQVALLEIEEDIERDFKKMEEVIHKDLFEIEIDARHILKKALDAKKWVHPPIAINQKLISGVIKRVSETRFYAFCDHSFENIIKIWPEILIYKIIFPEGREVVFIKDQTRFNISLLDAKALLAEYLTYFEAYLQKPSWLVPRWAKKAFSQDDLFSFALKESDESTSFFTDEYSNWFFAHFPESRNRKKGEEEQKKLQDLLPGMKEYIDANL